MYFKTDYVALMKAKEKETALSCNTYISFYGQCPNPNFFFSSTFNELINYAY